MAQGSELYKDKIEVSLDGRQIFYLFFGGAVIVGLVFVLGVMVGRRVEARGHVERAHVEAAVDPLAALDRLEGGSGLSFQGALRGEPTPAAPVEKAIEKAIEQKQVKPEAPKPEKPEKADKKAEKPAGEPKQVEKVADPDDKKPDDKKPDDKKPEKARFTLQLSSFQDRGEADTFVQSVKSAGFEAFVSEGEVDGRQFFRVRLGSYHTLEAANDAKAEFEKSAKKSALVTKL
ncbi:MAG TPA: SPOR domain-containing protein [Kofleriaceae bacterium]|jgi:cell division septation protein DedD